MKLKILKILNFSTKISIEISRPLVTKLRDLKMFNMAFQVVFSAKNVPRFSFGLLVAPKLKKRGGAIMAPPRAITSFQRPGQIGLRKYAQSSWFETKFTKWMYRVFAKEWSPQKVPV